MLKSILIASLGLCIVKAINPCIDAPELHDLPRRYRRYKVDTEINEPYVCDTLAIPPEGKWYKTSGMNMPTTPPDLFGCGTKYPIWLNGNLSLAINETVVRRACAIGIFSFCQKEISIQIKKCDEERYVYFLYQTTTCEMSFCFGEGQQDIPPNVETGEISVIHYMHQEIVPHLHNGYIERHRFQCNFETVQHLNIYYQVIWYIDDMFHVLKLVKKENVGDAVLKESDLLTIGIHIKCSVRLQNQPDSTPGPLKFSKNQFYGLQLVTEHISFPRSDVGMIKVKLTIPFGCPYMNNVQQHCQIQVSMQHPDTNMCQANGNIVGEERYCHYSIDKTDWDKEHEIPVKWQDGGDYQRSATEYVMQLKIESSLSAIWDKQANIPLIKIKVHDDNASILNKKCRIVESQFIHTFDGRIYIHRLTGVFVLYRDITNPSYEVQQETEICLGNNICNCGTAVRYGADVFVINFCGGRRVISFLTCQENKIQVSKENNLKYVVRVPSGAWIEIHLSSSVPPILTVFINPSVHDWMNSRGLCGFISHNCPDDFVKPDGTKAAIPGVDHSCSAPRIDSAEEFIQSWMVDVADNLFRLEPNAPLSPRITTLAYCTCPYGSLEDIDGSFGCGGATIDCSSPYVGSIGECTIPLNTQQHKQVYEYPKNSKRSFDLLQEKEPDKDDM